MGVRVRKRKGQWYVFVDFHGQRKAKCVGSSRKVAEEIKRQLEAKLVLGDLGVFGADGPRIPTFNLYADEWLKDYARVECKRSTAEGYEGVLRQYLRPRFGSRQLDEITRDDIKKLIGDLLAKDLSRNTIRNALCVIRGMFNEAIENRLVEVNPASRLGRFTRTAKLPDRKGVALTPAEAEQFLAAARDICPDYYPLFLIALRAGLRRGDWSHFNGEMFNSARMMRTRTATCSCSTTTFAGSTRQPRARKVAGSIFSRTSRHVTPSSRRPPPASLSSREERYFRRTGLSLARGHDPRSR